MRSCDLNAYPPPTSSPMPSSSAAGARYALRFEPSSCAGESVGAFRPLLLLLLLLEVEAWCPLLR